MRCKHAHANNKVLFFHLLLYCLHMSRAYFDVVLIFAGFWPFPRLITLFPCPDVSVLFRFTIGGGNACQTFAFEFCRLWRTCLRRLSRVCPGHDGYHFCTEILYNVIVSFRASSKIDLYATIADPIFTISYALLSYSTCLEASGAPSFVRVVLSVSRACFRYVRVYLLCAELEYRHGNDFILLWH